MVLVVPMWVVVVVVVPLLEGVEGNYLMTPRPGYAHGCRPKRYQLARCKKNVCCCCASLSLLVNQILTVDNANAIIRKPQLKMKCIYRSYCKFITSPQPDPVHQQMLSFLVCALQRFPFPWPFLTPQHQTTRERERAFWGISSSLSPFFLLFM